MKIAFFDVRDSEQDLMKNLFPGHEVIFSVGKITSQSVVTVQDADIVSIFTGSEIRKDVIDMMPNLKLIATRSTGFDNVDVKYANDKGIFTCNVPAYGTRTVAEFAFALILELSRKVSVGDDKMKKGDYTFDGMRGFDLDGKTLGVMGTGKIGKNSILIGKGFNMKIIATDLYPDTTFAEEQGFAYAPLDVLLSNSDVITIHAPYNETTHHLINKENISLMKKSAIIVNTARGEIIETGALLDALTSGKIAGAGVDVYEKERKLKQKNTEEFSKEDEEVFNQNKKLIGLHNVVATPHVAFFTNEAEGDICRVTVENINNFIAGKMQNIVK
jgi:D-lactate dehydrogenase